jgi:MFS family permease
MGFNLLGIVVGPLLGGAFTQYASWRWCFYMNLPAGGLTMLALLFLNIPEQEAKPKVATLLPRLHHYLDIVGFLLFAPAVLMLLLALQFGGQAYPWSSAQVIGLFCGAAATIFIWFFWNRHRGNDAMLPHGLLGRLDVVASGVYIALLTSALYAGVYFLPIYFQGVNGATAMQSAVYLLPTILGQLFAAGAAGGAITKIGFVIPIAIFSTVLLSIGTGLYSILEPGSPNAQWIGFQILAGVGAGAGLQLPIINVQAATNSEELSSGIAFVLLSFNLGPAITLTLFNVLFLSSLQDQIRGDNLLRGIDPEAVLAVGATGFKSLVPEDQLERLLEVFSTSLNHVFYLAAALVAICSIVLWGMGWHDLRKKSTPEEDAEVVAVKDSEHLDEEKTASQL